MNLDVMMSEGVDWIHMAIVRGNLWAAVNTAMCLPVS
jgi:hypothetical protein